MKKTNKSMAKIMNEKISELMKLRDKISVLVNNTDLEENLKEYCYCLGRLHMINDILEILWEPK